jgi:hypothetical protein
MARGPQAADGNIKDQVHQGAHGNDLPTVETQLLVVVRTVFMFSTRWRYSKMSHFLLAIWSTTNQTRL